MPNLFPCHSNFVLANQKLIPRDLESVTLESCRVGQAVIAMFSWPLFIAMKSISVALVSGRCISGPGGHPWSGHHLHVLLGGLCILPRVPG